MSGEKWQNGPENGLFRGWDGSGEGQAWELDADEGMV